VEKQVKQVEDPPSTLSPNISLLFNVAKGMKNNALLDVAL
jgi:hypothetical protein